MTPCWPQKDVKEEQRLLKMLVWLPKNLYGVVGYGASDFAFNLKYHEGKIVVLIRQPSSIDCGRVP